MSDFELAHKDNQARLDKYESILGEDEFHCIDANENVMKLNYEKLQSDLATTQQALEAQSEELAAARQAMELARDKLWALSKENYYDVGSSDLLEVFRMLEIKVASKEAPQSPAIESPKEIIQQQAQEIERLRALLKKIADNAPQGIEQPKKPDAYSHWVAGNFARTAIAATAPESPAPDVPKFKVGDKVRIKLCSYPFEGRDYEVIAEVGKAGGYRRQMRDGESGIFWWAAGELETYNESEPK